MDKYSEEFLREQIEVLGKSNAKIASEFGLKLHVLYKKSKEYGLKNKFELAEEKIPEIRRMYEDGAYKCDIAAKLGVSAVYIDKVTKDLTRQEVPKTKLTREFLEEHYVVNGLGAKEIAEMVGFKVGSINTAIRKYGFSKRRFIPDFLDKETLYDMYITKNMSLIDIAHSFNTNFTGSLKQLLVKYDIPINPKGHSYAGHKRGGIGRRSHEYLSGMVLNALNSSAKKRNIRVDITIDDIWNKYIAQNKKCAISNIPVTFPEYGSSFNKKDFTGSVDRIDSSIAYTPDNIQILHKYVNLMKLDHSQEEFIEWCHIISDYQKSVASKIDDHMLS